MVGEEVALVTGRTADAPVVHPDLEAHILGRLEDITHNLVVPLPVVVREHVHDDVHIRVDDLFEVLSDVRHHAVAVVGNAKL